MGLFFDPVVYPVLDESGSKERRDARDRDNVNVEQLIAQCS